MIKFTEEEEALLKKQDVARVATVSDKGWPQVTPVVHLYNDGFIYFIVDYGSRKEKNIAANNKVGVVVDVYSRQPQSVIIQGLAEAITKGDEFKRIERMFEERHAYYKSNPVKEGDAPIIKVTPVRKFSSL
ncbi:MAG: pyridoxamine 5'-phosphate oxidase family protein [Candidatus Marsarchaeota archaeon]|nr:pyridoxamine 5'-phosphate oxidase family protein [Candidatus Marsarchaeota archaeon]